MRAINHDDVPASADERLEELGLILARGVLRMEGREPGWEEGNGVDFPGELSPCVSRTDKP